MKDFRNRNALVTGAGSGIGRALAHALADAGANVFVTDIDPGRLDPVVAELRAKGVRADGRVVDHTNAQQVRALHGAFVDRWGTLDVLCANVGVAYTAAISDMTLADWERVMAVNFWSAVNMVQLFVPGMIDARRGGDVLVTASMAGILGLPSASAYCASKFALVGLAESLRAELARHHIGVTAICPGIVRTNFAKDGRFSFGGLPVRAEEVDRLWQLLGEEPEAVARTALAAVRSGGGVVPSAGLAARVPWALKRLFGGAMWRGLALAWRSQDLIVRLLGEDAPPGSGAIGFDELRRMSGPALDALYASAATPDLEELGGEYEGALLRWKLEPAMDGLDLRAIEPLPWKGKVFMAGTKRQGRGANRFVLGRQTWPFQTAHIDSRFGGARAVAIDYDIPGNPWWLRHAVFDEMKKLRDGLYLGKGGVQLGRRRLIFTWSVARPS
jgi:NAD(P)-dependent dehydrogenase (short-subunit alcohol dehydrogenase family)